MKSNLTKFALSAGIMLALAFTLSCSGGGDGGGDNPANNNTPSNNNNGGTPSAGLVCADGEVWAKHHEGYSCALLMNGTDGIEFKSNGDAFESDYRDGVWKRTKTSTWQTDGNTLTFIGGRTYTYEISNNNLNLNSDGRQTTLTKCSGMTIE
ncbi:MAG: hypothetical protein LBC64_08700 [Fibromonadaceae bacterium]|jgi:hypothetical protein|nr:hypothetical protein [Fibromonadaceae bacterium]